MWSSLAAFRYTPPGCGTTVGGQVSWLPDRRFRAAFPAPYQEVTSGVWRGRSPVTVAGAAEASHLLPSSVRRKPDNP